MINPYVVFVTDKIYIKNVTKSFETKLLELEASIDSDYPEYWSIPYSDTEDKIEKFIKLNDLDVYFSAGKDWSPSEQFEEYREKGKIKGKYKKISWSSPSKSTIKEI